jgi:hypothetical protein
MSALHMMRMNGDSGVATVTFSMLIDGLALAVSCFGCCQGDWVRTLRAEKTTNE